MSERNLKIAIIILGISFIISIIGLMPVEITEIKSAPLIIPYNISKTIQVPYIVEKEIQIPYNETHQEIMIVDYNETLPCFDDFTIIPDGDWVKKRVFLEKGCNVSLNYSIEALFFSAFIYNSEQYQVFRKFGKNDDCLASESGFGEKTMGYLEYVCTYDDEYYFVIKDIKTNYAFEPPYSNVKSSEIKKYWSEKKVTEYNVTSYRTETIQEVKYREESIIETKFETDIQYIEFNKTVPYIYKILGMS
jgi:hypothetical protein